MKQQPYLYYCGLKQLASEMRGDEKIHMGIRPFGFHAGNILALVAYPFLLCEALEALQKHVNVEFIISINDYEQDALAGPDIRAFPFNIYPEFTSLKFAKDPNTGHIYVDHWQPIIEKNLLELKKYFPNVQFNFIRNSELKSEPEFKRLLLDTIRKLTGKIVLDEPLQFAGILCPTCHAAAGKTTVTDERISWKCDHCSYQCDGVYEDFDYWWHHKPLLIARLKIYQVDITLSGGDHYQEGDFEVRQGFIDRYYSNFKTPKMLFTPIMIAENGLKMSKSRKNMKFASARALINTLRGWDVEEFPWKSEYEQCIEDEKNDITLL